MLASGQVTLADRLGVELVKPTDTPPVILIKWPPQPSVVEPVKLQATVAAIIKAGRRAAGL